MYLDRTFAQRTGSAKVKSKSEVTHSVSFFSESQHVCRQFIYSTITTTTITVKLLWVTGCDTFY